MKKLGAFACICLLGVLCACQAQPQWETVEDEMATAVSAMDSPYVITFGVPGDAVAAALTESADTQLYVQDGGDYEILSDVVSAVSLDSALRQVSGFDQQALSVVETTRFGLPEYQFAWSSASDEGTYVSRAALVQDGGYYYALVFSVREGLGTAYDDCADAVFASFGLYGDEQF